MRFGVLACFLLVVPIACEKPLLDSSDLSPRPSGTSIPITFSRTTAANLIVSGEDPSVTREARIAELRKKFPDIVDEFLLASLRGKHETVAVSIDGRYPEAAKLIGEIYGLLYVEMRAHPERFRRPEVKQ